jgi:hypothetical protein
MSRIVFRPRQILLFLIIAVFFVIVIVVVVFIVIVVLFAAAVWSAWDVGPANDTCSGARVAKIS